MTPDFSARFRVLRLSAPSLRKDRCMCLVRIPHPLPNYPTFPGCMAEWLCRGLQSLAHRFDSGCSLQVSTHIPGFVNSIPNPGEIFLPHFAAKNRDPVVSNPLEQKCELVQIAPLRTWLKTKITVTRLT